MYKKVPSFKKEIRKQLKRINDEAWGAYKHTRKIMKKELAHINYEAMAEKYSTEKYYENFAEYWNDVAEGYTQWRGFLKPSDIRVILLDYGDENKIVVTVTERYKE